MSKVLSALAIIVGAAATIADALAAFGIDLTDQQTGALSGIGSLLLLVLGVWFHPSIPVGNVEPPADPGDS